jgi:hypothetical protein
VNGMSELTIGTSVCATHLERCIVTLIYLQVPNLALFNDEEQMNGQLYRFFADKYACQEHKNEHNGPGTCVIDTRPGKKSTHIRLNMMTINTMCTDAVSLASYLTFDPKLICYRLLDRSKARHWSTLLQLHRLRCLMPLQPGTREQTVRQALSHLVWTFSLVALHLAFVVATVLVRPTPAFRRRISSRLQWRRATPS